MLIQKKEKKKRQNFAKTAGHIEMTLGETGFYNEFRRDRGKCEFKNKNEIKFESCEI